MSDYSDNDYDSEYSSGSDYENENKYEPDITLNSEILYELREYCKENGLRLLNLPTNQMISMDEWFN